MDKLNRNKIIKLKSININNNNNIIIYIMDIDENDTLEEQFMFELHKSFESGDLKYIQDAIKYYKNKINNDYIVNANNLLIQLLNEKMEENII